MEHSRISKTAAVAHYGGLSKKILIFTLFLSCTLANAQDVITLRNAEQIRAKVTEISPSEIRYKRFEHLEGPTVVIPKSDVFAINYENGTREVINPFTETSSTQTVSEASRTQPARETNRERTTTNSSGDKAFGGSLIIGTGNSYTHWGIGAKYLYNVTNAFRLAGEFDFFPKKDFISWWDLSAYGHYLFSANDRITLYPSAGIGFVGMILDFGGENFSENVFAFSIGGGIDYTLPSNPNLMIFSELRFKFFDDINRINFAAGLAYKF